MNIRNFPVSQHWIIIIDALLILTTVAMFVSQNIVFLFHLIFIWLAIGAFFWNFQAFAVRAFFWVLVAASMVGQAILSGQTQRAELIEIPLLSSILATVFFIASRRARVQTSLDPMLSL